jgi:hypothetical protein
LILTPSLASIYLNDLDMAWIASIMEAENGFDFPGFLFVRISTAGRTIG